MTALEPKLSRDPQPADNLILWLPVFLSGGIGTYFALAAEPSAIALMLALAAMIGIAAVTFRWRYIAPWRWVAAFAISFLLGMIVMQQRTGAFTVPILNQPVWSAQVTGTIDSFERMGMGWRVELNNAHIDKGAENYVLRLSIRAKGFNPVVGGITTLRASVMQPSSSIVPGSYDFRRHAFFHGLSGYGYATQVLAYQPPPEIQHKNYLEEYRDWLTDRVYSNLHQPEAGIVSALLNGQRAGISHATTNVLQQSGLQHVISISGLHVGLMAITVFYFTRLLMALNMHFALRFPIKKIAAFLALLSIVFYMLIVGNSPPTLRSVLMSGMALVAIMLDREPIQMRVVALSALGILLLQPESLIDIGFQMSFAAVIGLVAFYQQTKAFWSHETWQSSLIMKGLRVLLITIVTSLIATIITAPLVLLYFQQIPLLSMLANLLATPPITFLIMPGTFLSYLFTPLPLLGDFSIRLMGWGVTLMMEVATFVAHLPSAVWHAPPLPLVAVYTMLLGVYIVIVVKHRLRWLGLVAVLIGLDMLPLFPQPDLLVTQNRLVLYPDPHSNLLFADGKMQSFDKNLLLHWTGKEKTAPFNCTEEICDLQIKDKTVRLIRTVPALHQACSGKADLIVTRYYLDRRCRDAVIIDRHRLEKMGGQAIFLNKEIKTESVLAHENRRPWQAPPVIDKYYSRR